MDDARGLTRRTAIALGGAGALGGVVTLAGCTTGGGSGGTDTSATPDTSAAAGQEVAALADIPVGGSIDATIGGEPVLVAQPTAGEVVAFSAICTHQGCVVAAAGDRFECPCHGSVFDAATGDVLQGPAPDPLPSVPVSVEGDRVVAG
ncbi:ubiquinol-cytochrome c reductase iron-sulfur subunit [Agromyces aurantiacus]|uniref:Cytochrome bc1 complex Rieske iron-sulfur subunit n=1 Tax=Agromyces aurantiacus TaxID=165814 RepID=A0ABV9R9X4_9MICO|nr:Rieske (2Fe-2S) protein [Agromyces aurantiacus]MBM7504986.1 Rieske Fe-S protein [Agromyces aurantiacus]